MTMDILRLHCLNSLCDDYENVDTVISDVRRATHANVTKREIEESLSQILKEELAAAYDFDAEKSEYLVSPGPLNNLSQKWFLITEKGRERLEENWIDE